MGGAAPGGFIGSLWLGGGAQVALNWLSDGGESWSKQRWVFWCSKGVARVVFIGWSYRHVEQGLHNPCLPDLAHQSKILVWIRKREKISIRLWFKVEFGTTMTWDRVHHSGWCGAVQRRRGGGEWCNRVELPCLGQVSRVNPPPLGYDSGWPPWWLGHAREGEGLDGPKLVFILENPF
jgi:hypothetical protein